MMQNNQRKTSSFARLLMLFSSILLFFLALTANNTHYKLEKEEEKQAKLLQINSLDEIIAATSREGFVKNRFDSIAQVVESEDFTTELLLKQLEKIKSEFKTELKCFYYENHILKTSFQASKSELELLTDLMQHLNADEEQFKIAQRRAHKALLDRFGPGNRLELVRSHRSQIINFQYQKKKQHYFWNTYSQNRAIFVIVTDIPEFIARFAIIREKLGRPDAGAGKNSSKEFLAPRNLPQDQMLAAKIKANLTGNSTIVEFGQRWSFIEDQNGQYYCTAEPLRKKPTHFRTFTFYVFILSSALCIILLATYILSFFGIFPGKNICEWLDSFSIRFRIIGLFTMASVFPVIFTALIGATSLSERAEIIENQVAAESIANLNRLESMISVKLEQSEKMAKSIRHKLIHTTVNEEFFQKYLKQYGIPRSLTRLEVRNSEGGIIFSTDDPEVHGVSQAMDVFSRVALKLHAPHRLGKNANMITPAEIVSESVLSTDEIGMATILRQRGRQWIFRMGTFPTVWFYDVYPELATGPVFMHYTAQMIRVYNSQVREKLALPSQNLENLQLTTQINYSYNNGKIYPLVQGIDRESLLKAALASFKTGKVLFRNTLINGTPYWVTIKPEKMINAHIFFNLISKPKRLASLEPLRNQLIIAGILALMVSFAGAMLLIKLFIKPIGNISLGISAIREREHDFRIEVTRNDEFGVLSNAFNKVIEELKELEYGRVVQESLLPERFSVPNGYDLACFRTSATDLAGDYHDILPLNDGRLAIILGDVTGHGISAALAMAMAKATVDYLDLEGRLFPSSLMDNLNALFNRELKPRHKFMTLVTLVLNPESGELITDNAGQSYPYYYVAASKNTEEIQIPSMPLGATKKRRAKPEIRFMQSGDAVILYSDGIIECANESGDMFGYERLNQTFVELLEKQFSAQQILDEMMQKLDAFRKAGPYPDDVTLVLLKKL